MKFPRFYFIFLSIFFSFQVTNFKVLLTNLTFPNGVQIFPDRRSVLIAETTLCRIVRYYFAGPKKGKREVFAKNLPGTPDNIRLSTDGKSILVALEAVRNKANMQPALDLLAPHPSLRKYLAQVVVVFSLKKRNKYKKNSNKTKRSFLIQNIYQILEFPLNIRFFRFRAWSQCTLNHMDLSWNWTCMESQSAPIRTQREA